MPAPMHEGELHLTATDAMVLIAASFPAYAGETAHRIESQGTVNAVFRVADAAARFPLQAAVPDELRMQLTREAERMGRFADLCPVAAPRPIGIGKPAARYPQPWSMQTWVEGTVPGPREFEASDALADDVAALLSALRAVDVTGEQFRGYGRGDALEPFDTYVRDGLVRSIGLVDVDALRRVWDELRSLPVPEALSYSHTDLIPGNLLVHDGRLVGVLDAGDASAADPALDLIAAWHLFDAPHRERVRRALDVGDDEWQRGRAWALVQAIGLVWYYVDSNRAMAELGRSTLARVVEG